MSKPTKSRLPAGEKGTADRIEADEGGYWVRLVTRQALDREGRAMDHCVGDGAYDHVVGSEEISDDSLWSLRRADGVSVLTVQVRGCELVYARGYSNKEPGKGACLQVRYLAQAFAAAGHRLRVDEDTGIVLLADGRSFRRDRLPPEIVAAREAAERARMAERAERRRQEREQQVGADAWSLYEIPWGQAVFRSSGRPVEIRSDERPDRPIIDPAFREGEAPRSTGWFAALFQTNPGPSPGPGGSGTNHRAADAPVRQPQDQPDAARRIEPPPFGGEAWLYRNDPQYRATVRQAYHAAIRRIGQDRVVGEAPTADEASFRSGEPRRIRDSYPDIHPQGRP